ncbi:MAG: molybdopterin-dependent oxidoreductase [Pseudomonadales bacterium]|nr:molybdopterin-dependent oxidoreductase [Pseudomonadales bacterium]
MGSSKIDVVKMEKVHTHFRTCSICEASCGIIIKHDEEQVLSIKPDKDDVLSQGHICPKAVALQDLHTDPARLKHPIKRVGRNWQRISWEEAFSLVADNVKRIQNQHGQNAMGLYIGNPTAHNHGALLMLMPFISALNTRSRFSATSCDQLPHMLAAMKMFGHHAMFEIPDLNRTHYFLMFGANPIASGGSVMTAPNIQGRFKGIQRRGGKIVLFDPRKTETADKVDEHLFIKPGSDALVLMAMIQVLFRDNKVKLGKLASHIDGLEKLKTLSANFSPDKVAAVTGVSETDIERITAEFSAAKSAVAYGRMGAATQPLGALTCWLIYVLNAITGNLDVPGGAMFSNPAVDFVGVTGIVGETGSFDRYRSRNRRLPEFAGELPVVTMAEEILTEGPGQIKGMIVHAGNPVLSVPNGRRLDKAFQQLEFVACVDFYLNETTRHAHVILPPTGPLEHGHFDMAMHSVAVHNTIKYSPPLFKPEADTRHDWEILAELAARFEANKSRYRGLIGKLQLSLVKRLTDEGMIDLLLRAGPYGAGLNLANRLETLLGANSLAGKGFQRLKLSSKKLANQLPLFKSFAEVGPYGDAPIPKEGRLSLRTLRRHPHGIDLGPLRSVFPERIYTKNQKIDLAPDLYVGGCKRLLELLDVEQSDQLLMIGRRHVRSNNSWLHNSQRLVKGKSRCTLWMHPQDVEKLGLMGQHRVLVGTAKGKVEIPLEVTEDIMPGVVSFPHGWGHNREGIDLPIAQQHAGVSMNDITDEEFADPLTGMAIVNAVPVVVEAAVVQQPQSQSTQDELQVSA